MLMILLSLTILIVFSTPDHPESLSCYYNYSSTGALPAPDVISIIQGRPLFSLSCTAASNPPPTYTWSGTLSGGWVDDGNGVLAVTSVSRTLNHSYTITVQNEMMRTFGGTQMGNLARTQEMHVLCN